MLSAAGKDNVRLTHGVIMLVPVERDLLGDWLFSVFTNSRVAIGVVGESVHKDFQY